ncbi:nucleotidyl transferase AbiEii/AbiGii toxin family protein [Leptospirillum ferriphilum]|uniref:nucleotidyl transferase AbiEii/AbiGii toxin family protein n=1 Tax=Leptospirillum ferriphilum TaxID=178606 RepID=UPI0006B23151|nr:nucleotidyl transferase AbiEii/AbiGii toxin family protein [Leptospirillum ferriphilum]
MLTPLQRSVLGFLFEEERIGELGFFLTGGTALAAFHLHHRISEDLDLFVRRDDLDFGILFRGLSENLKKFGGVETALVSKSFLRIFLHAPNGQWDRLKIEFAQEVPARIASPLTIDHVIVDSLEDIATNKISAILGRDKPRDLFDLYAILSGTSLTLEVLFKNAIRKDASFEHKEALYGFVEKIREAFNLSQEVFLSDVHPVRPENVPDMARYLNGAIDKFLEGLENVPQPGPSSGKKSAPDMEP